MSTSEFINKYSTYKTDSNREQFLQSTIKRSYVPLLEKVDICQSIKKNTECITSVPKSIASYVMFLLFIIDSYTSININFQQERLFSEYDLLRANGVISLLLGFISEEEISEFNLIMDAINDKECGVIYGEKDTPIT